MKIHRIRSTDMQRRKLGLRQAAAASAALLALSACGQGKELHPSGSAGSGERSALDAETVAGVFAVSDYDTVGQLEPDVWVKDPRIKVVVVGAIESYADGPKIQTGEKPDDRYDVPTLVMKVAVSEVIKGAAPQAGFTYVQLRVLADEQAAAKALPRGTKVALYLENPPQSDPTLVVRDPGAGRPEGEPVWLVSPLAFVVADETTGGILLPLLAEHHEERSFDSQLPSAAGRRP